MTRRAYWLSWIADGPFRYDGPWWVSGEYWSHMRRYDTIVAAVMAESEEQAKQIIVDAHEQSVGPRRRPIEWRFCGECPEGWHPLKTESDRFPPAPWMQWPWPPPDGEPRVCGVPFSVLRARVESANVNGSRDAVPFGSVTLDEASVSGDLSTWVTVAG